MKSFFSSSSCSSSSLFCFVLFFVTFCVAVDLDLYVQVPGGAKIHRDCVREIPSGSFVEELENGETAVNGQIIPRCPHKAIMTREMPKSTGGAPSLPANGWQTWTAFEHPQNKTFSTFNGYFSVPDAPAEWGFSSRAGIIYIFTGLQNENWVPDGSIIAGAPPFFEIIQPVLQYGGGSYNGGGLYWGAASWYVTVDAGALYSTELTVQPGDKIYGTMEQQDAFTWKIGSTVPSGENSELTVKKRRLIYNPWAYCTLEVYNIKNCTWLPPSASPSHFTEMVLKDSQQTFTPDWTILTEDSLGGPSQNPCGSSFSVVSGTQSSSVDLSCQSQ